MSATIWESSALFSSMILLKLSSVTMARRDLVSRSVSLVDGEAILRTTFTHSVSCSQNVNRQKNTFTACARNLHTMISEYIGNIGACCVSKAIVQACV